MSAELSSALHSCFERLLELAASDERLRDGVTRLGNALLVLSTPSPGPLAAEGAFPPVEEPIGTRDATSVAAESETALRGGPPAAAAPAAEPPLPPATPRTEQHVIRLRPPLGRTEPIVYVTGAASRPAAAAGPAPRADLSGIALRCRVKQRAAGWAADRAAAEAGGANGDESLRHRRQELEDEAAALPECSLWMLDEARIENDVPDAWSALAASYAATDAAVTLMEATLSAGESCNEFIHAALLLTAEAQSGLRVAVKDITEQPDPDQDRAFHWLRDFADAERHFVERYMKLTDPADPANAADLLARIAALRTAVDNRRQSGRDRKRQLSALKYHAGLVLRNPDEEHDHDWRKIVESVAGLVAGGLPPSSVDLRMHLLPIYDMLPDLDGLPENVERVLREVDRYLASRPAEEPASASPALSAQVQEVARLLGGKTVVLVGGDERSAARRKLEEAFGLERLIWVATSEQNTRITFEGEIARPEVALVLLAIRWIRHALNDTRELAWKHQKPLVNLPGGYNPNQVAEQILRQRGRDLSAALRT